MFHKAFNVSKLPFSKRREFLRKFGKVRNGSSRIALEINDKWVIKVAYNEKGIVQNRVEYDVYKYATPYQRKFLARINLRVQREVDYHYIVQEKVFVYRSGNQKDLAYKKLIKSESFKNFCNGYELCRTEMLEQLGRNNKGKVVTYDYGFNKETKKYYNY